MSKVMLIEESLTYLEIQNYLYQSRTRSPDPYKDARLIKNHVYVL